MAHVRTYSASVRVGNWNEDIQLEEDTIKDFLVKRANGQLLIQKSSGIIGQLSNPVKLSTCRDGAIHFGDVVMVLNRGNPDRTSYGVGQYPRDDSALAIHIADGATPGGPIPYVVTGTKKLTPCARTAFKIVPADDYAKAGDKLRYGQPFSLATVSEDVGCLYLFSDRALFDRCTEKARQQVATLVPEQTFNTSWQIEHKNPVLRLEYENEPVMANEECIIQHCKTHQNLCVEETCFTPTLFGTEYEISAHTNLDSHKADLPVNKWCLMVASAGDASYPIALTSAGDQAPVDVQPSV